MNSAARRRSHTQRGGAKVFLLFFQTQRDYTPCRSARSATLRGTLVTGTSLP